MALCSMGTWEGFVYRTVRLGSPGTEGAEQPRQDTRWEVPSRGFPMSVPVVTQV